MVIGPRKKKWDYEVVASKSIPKTFGKKFKKPPIPAFKTKEKHALADFFTSEDEHDFLQHLVNNNAEDDTPLFPFVKQIYMKLEAVQFGKLIRKFEKASSARNFVRLLELFEEKLLLKYKQFALKAMEQ